MANLTQRSPQVNTSVCFYSPAEWSVALPNGSSCNCSNLTMYYSVNGTQPPACIIACLDPNILFPYTIGFDNTASALPNCSSALVSTTFTNQSTLQAFLTYTFPTTTGFGPNQALDPSNTSLPTLEAGAFLQQLLTAQLNDFYNEVYQPSYAVIYDNAALPSCAGFTLGIPITDAQFNGALFAAVGPDITMHEVINVIVYVFYAQANFPIAGGGSTALVKCNIPQLWSVFPGAFAVPAYGWGISLMTFAGTWGWSLTARYLTQFLQLYNQAYPGCGGVTQPNATTCFPSYRIPTTPAPPVCFSIFFHHGWVCAHAATTLGLDPTPFTPMVKS